MMGITIKGKISDVIGNRIAINIGENFGVISGMIFNKVCDPIIITDPDTKEKLGEVIKDNIPMTVTKVYEKFSVCECKDNRSMWRGNAIIGIIES